MVRNEARMFRLSGWKRSNRERTPDAKRILCNPSQSNVVPYGADLSNEELGQEARIERLNTQLTLMPFGDFLDDR